MSIHRVDIVKIEGCEPHPDPEVIRLGLVRVGGFVIIVNKEQWTFPCMAAYIQPDSLVNVERPEFEFLKARADGKQTYRVRVMKLKGFYSQGLLIPAPEGFKEGDDAAEFLEVQHYEPPIEINTKAGRSIKAPRRKIIQESIEVGDVEVFAPVYDVENYNRFVRCLTAGEEVVATEKVHGANARFCCVDGQIYVGSRTQWKEEDECSPWWVATRNHPEIVEFLKQNENVVAYGEVYGRVQKLRYGCDNEVRIALFDLLRDNQWMNWDKSQELVQKYGLPWVPTVYRGEFDETQLRALAEGDSIMPNAPSKHIREGLVVKPVIERHDYKLGRVLLKMISNRYLDKT